MKINAAEEEAEWNALVASSPAMQEELRLAAQREENERTRQFRITESDRITKEMRNMGLNPENFDDVSKYMERRYYRP